ncbi:MAG: hypothetical protein AB1345_13570, partial [Chloroflexota bacterium]
MNSTGGKSIVYGLSVTLSEQPMLNTEHLRVCYFGTYRAQYPRNRIMIEGLRRNGVEVVECHTTLWRGIEDRVQVVVRGWFTPGFWWRVIYAYGRLLQRYRQVGSYDVLVVGYPGLLDVILARGLSWWRGKPLVWDVFMSLYLIACERNLDQRNPLAVSLLRWLERLACTLPDLLILDTQEYMHWLCETHRISARRF